MFRFFAAEPLTGSQEMKWSPVPTEYLNGFGGLGSEMGRERCGEFLTPKPCYVPVLDYQGLTAGYRRTMHFRYDTASLVNVHTLSKWQSQLDQHLLVPPFNFLPVDNIPDRLEVFCLAVLVLKTTSVSVRIDLIRYTH
jgi:hypothetical protein